jgi:phage gp37-like protein
MIAAAEDAIVARIKKIAGDGLRACESLPANFDVAEVHARARLAPAVYVSFLGGEPLAENDLVLDARFAVFVLTGGGNELQRRRGAAPAQGSGAYALMMLILPLLHGHTLKDIGTLTCTAVDNLYSDALDQLGVSLYSATFKVPVVLDASDDPEGDLAAFLHFHADYLVPPHQPPQPVTLPLAAPDASDDVTLPQS